MRTCHPRTKQIINVLLLNVCSKIYTIKVLTDSTLHNRILAFVIIRGYNACTRQDNYVQTNKFKVKYFS